MSRYAASGKTLTTTAATNLLSIRSTASVRARIVEWHIFGEAAAAFANPSLFLTTVVDTSGTAVAGQKFDPDSATPSCTVQTGPTGGTLAAVAHFRAVTPATIGTGFIWSMVDPANPLIVPKSLSAVFRNDHASSAGPAVTWVIVWDE